MCALMNALVDVTIIVNVCVAKMWQLVAVDSTVVFTTFPLGLESCKSKMQFITPSSFNVQLCRNSL